MAKSKFDDLHDDLDDEVRELRPKGREPDRLERILSMMAESQARMAESQARTAELDAELALRIQQAEERQKRANQEASALHLKLIGELSEHVDDRFNRIEKAQKSAEPEALTVKEQIAQQLLELLQVGMVLGKKYMEEKIND